MKNGHDCFVTKYLIMFLSIQALFVFVVVVLINSVFVFPNLCRVLLETYLSVSVPAASSGPVRTRGQRGLEGHTLVISL